MKKDDELGRVVAKTLAAFALAAIPAAAQGCDLQPDRMSVLIGSDHIGAQGEMNGRNPGLFVSWNCKGFEVSAGAYQNSYDNQSVAGTVSYAVLQKGWFKSSPFLGLARYPEYGELQVVSYGDIVPLVGLQTVVGNAFVQVLPGDQETVDVVIAFGLTFEIGRAGQ